MFLENDSGMMQDLHLFLLKELDLGKKRLAFLYGER